MDHFAGLDVSVKETSLCIVDDTGRIVREVKNELLSAEIAKRDAPPEWIALKAADRGQFTYECIRSWCKAGVIVAVKRGGRWFVKKTSLAAHLAELTAA